MKKEATDHKIFGKATILFEISSLIIFVLAKLLQSYLIPCDLWSAVLQSHLSMGFSARILQWVGMPSPGDLSNPGIELRSHVSHWLAGSLPPAPPYLAFINRLTLFHINHLYL